MVQRTASKILQKELPVGKFISEISKSPIYQASKVKSRLGPISSALPQNSTTGIQSPESAMQGNTYTNNLSQSPQDVKLDEKTYITGLSPEEWMKAKIDAEAKGNDKAAKAYLENYNAEVNNQKLTDPSAKIGTPMTQIQVALVKGGSRNLKNIKERYGIYKDGKLVGVKLNDMKKSTLTGGVIDPTYKSMAEKVVIAVLRPESGAAIPPEEMSRYVAMFLPQWYDSQESALYKLQDVEARFKDLGIE